MKSFSVIIPAFNAAGTIERALRSCIRQSFPPLEILVIDDGSTDDTAQIVAQFKTKVRLIKLYQNFGVSTARNRGWDEAVGDYIAFLDSDDEWHQDRLQIFALLFQQDMERALIANAYSVADLEVPLIRDIPLKSLSFAELLIRNPAQTSCICLKRTLGFRFDPKFDYCEDHDLVLRIAYKEPCFKLPLMLTKLGRPQLSKGGLSANIWKMRLGEIKMYAKLYKLNGAFVLLIPFLCFFSLLKYLRKVIQLKF